MRRLSVTLTCLVLTCCKHVPEPESVSNIPQDDIKLEDVFYPPPTGGYHPRVNRAPPFWPPHEHVVELPADTFPTPPWHPTIN